MDGLEQVVGALLRGVWGGDDLEGRLASGRCARAAARVADDAAQIFEQGLKAVDGCAVVKDLRMHLIESGMRSFGGCHRIASVLGLLVFIAEEQLAPGFHHVPRDIVRQHAEEDVGLDAILEPVSDRPDVEIDGLQ